MNPIRHLLCAAAIAACGAAAIAVTPSEEIMRLGSNFYAYPYTRCDAPDLTPAPEGYTPFHIEHYGRHGSRWHIGKRAYNRPVELLEIAERNQKLTPRGQELLSQLREIRDASIGRDGELTPLGAIQHRGIARRMVRNFPEVFADSAYVTARSSTVVRCILSMDNELQEMQAANPRLRITSDASEGDMWYIARDDTTGMDPLERRRMHKQGDEALREWGAAHPATNDFLSVIITDPAWAQDSIDVNSLFHYLFNVAANAQSLDCSAFPNYAPWDIFTEQELRDRWTYNNISWFLRYGNSEITGNLMPHYQQALLRNIIESADTALTAGPGANLRFGHEVILMPLAVLLELDDYGREYNDLDVLAEEWPNWDIFPMGSNIQLIFYRNSEGDVLVKALLNEKERRLPATPVTDPYYRWSDLREHYLHRLER
ncbi:MAG: histidine-type phosphatase [Bacteroidales bacterium]|nr:histidine-type phosphatase [Bacteroidales bacterium]